MDLSEMSPMDRNRAVEVDLLTLQDILAEAYTRVGGSPDPVAHRRGLSRLEAVCAVLRETSQMSGPKSSKRVLSSLVIALRQMHTATSIGLVGMDKMTYDQVMRQIGSKTPAVRQNYITYRLLLQMEGDEAISRSEE